MSVTLQCIIRIILTLTSTLMVKTNSINLTLSAGPSSLPLVLYGGLIAINSQNQLILMGGCTDTGAYISSYSFSCPVSMSSLNVYLWDISSSPTYQSIDSININYKNQAHLWNPSNGYPYPIDHRTDIMYIPWYNITNQYDTINRKWITNKSVEIITPIPVYHSCNVYDNTANQIYLLGGTTYYSESQQYYGSVQIYDINTNSWISYLNIASMPSSVYGGSCVLSTNINQKSIYHFGGRIHTGSAIASILKYNINENEWFTLNTELAHQTFGGRAIIVNNTNVFIIGGAVLYASGSVKSWLSSIWSFNIIDESIELVTTMDFYRYAPQIALVNGHVYIGGGKHGSTIFSDTEWSIEEFVIDNYTSNIDRVTTTSTQQAISTTIQPTVSITSQQIVSGSTSMVGEGTTFTEQIGSTKTTIKQTNIMHSVSSSMAKTGNNENDDDSMIIIVVMSIVLAIVLFGCCLLMSYIIYQKYYSSKKLNVNVDNIKLSLHEQDKQKKYNKVRDISKEGTTNDDTDLVQIVNQTELVSMQQL